MGERFEKLGGGEKYFVRTREDGPEKGPYTLEQLKQSMDNNLLKGSAIARAEHDDASRTKTLTELFTGQELKKARDWSAAKQELAEHEAKQSKKSANSQIVVGIGAIAAGTALSLFGFAAASASGGGSYIVFTGVIAFGVVSLLRGLKNR